MDGGPWREGDNQNHYDLFSAGGLDFVVVGLVMSNYVEDVKVDKIMEGAMLSVASRNGGMTGRRDPDGVYHPGD